jgi:AraC family transcriptional regulator of adaptative response / DNA-3-methyladenine glycosylase II
MTHMWMDADRCYRALRTHDARFDGRLYVGVSSTRVYCRPVCTARAPRRDRCRFFATAAAAEAQGYRPCLRCRPELAPGNAVVDAPHGLASRVAGLIEDGALADGRRLDGLAARLGVTDRHLRRVFQTEFGVSPIAFAQTQRLLLAKRLLTDTALPVTEVALASGFASLRRFNALFRTRYRLSPTDLRRRRPSPPPPDDGFRFRLRYRAPFAWSAMLDFLSARAVAGVEEVDGGRYRRTVRLRHRDAMHTGWIAVALTPGHDAVELLAPPSLSAVLPLVVARVKRLFDLACPIHDVEAALGTLAARTPGLRVPGAFDGFETAVRAVLGQQVTVKAARTLAGRFAETFGERLEAAPGGLRRVFPAASAVAALEPGAVAALGIVGARARAIVHLARAVDERQIVLEPGGDVPATIDRLRAIAGIGDWTAQYVAMRALAWPDAFPEDDAGIRLALGERSRARIRALASAWQPWRSYAVMHLWRGLAPRPSVEVLE